MSSFTPVFGLQQRRIALAAALACAATFLLAGVGLDANLASAAGTLGACLGLRMATRAPLTLDVAVAAYGASFVGMTRIFWLDSLAAILLAGLGLCAAAVLAFVLLARHDCAERPVARGCGGRLGTVAALASLGALQALGLMGIDVAAFAPGAAAAGGTPLFGTLVPSVIGASATVLAMRRTSRADEPAARVIAAVAVAGLGLGAMLLVLPPGHGALAAFYAGCFLGMCTRERLFGRLDLLAGCTLLVPALALVGRVMPGVGGGLGLAAFIAVLATLALKWLFSVPTERAPR